MKLLHSLLITAVIGRTLLEEAADVMNKDEGEDISYSNMKLSNTRLVQAFPGKMKFFLPKNFITQKLYFY